MYEQILELIKSNVNNKNAKFNCAPCPDSRRGTVEYKQGKIFYKKNCQEQQSQKLIFILESPHKEEFREDFSPIAPAQGATGRNFENALENVCVLIRHHHSVFEEGSYEIWLVNAIQYQVSLGLNPKQYRSILFQIVWFSFGMTDFINRIKKLCGNNENFVLINACTKGNDFCKTKADILKSNFLTLEPLINTDKNSLDLSKLVDDAIKKSKLRNRCLKTSHPYKWDKLII